MESFPDLGTPGWSTRPLGDLAEMRKGRVVSSSPVEEADSLPYIGADAFGGEYTAFTRDAAALTCESTDVLMLWDGERSGLCATGLRGAVSSTVARLRPKRGVHGGFLQRQLAQHFDWIQARRTGTGVPHVPADLLSLLNVSAPDDLREQRATAAVLDAFDSAIARSEAEIAKLRQLRTSLLREFISGSQEYDVEHPLGDTRALGWRARTVRECLLADPYNGLYKPASFIGRGTLLVGQTSISSDRGLDWTQARRAEVTEAELDRYALRQGDILLSRVYATLAGVGRPALVSSLPEPAVYESNMMRLRVDPRVVSARFLFELLRSDMTRAQVETAAQLSNQASINRTALRTISVALPPLSQQEYILELVDQHDSLVAAEVDAVAKLKAVNAGLAADLLAGRVRLPPDLLAELAPAA